MPKRPTKRGSRKTSSLQSRVVQLESQYRELSEDMGQLHEDLSTMRGLIRQVDTRQERGEKLLLEMQVDQQRALRALERISGALHIVPSAVPPATEEP